MRRRFLGFAMGMIRGGPGWLPARYLSPLFHQGTVAYWEGRARFPVTAVGR